MNADLKDKISANSVVSFEKQNDPNEINKIHYLPILLSSKEVFSGEFIDEAYVTTGRRNNFGPEAPEVACDLPGDPLGDAHLRGALRVAGAYDGFGGEKHDC